MAPVQRYEDLVAWQKAYALVLRIYATTSNFPSDERYGLTSQMRRCAIGIPSNIAEGFARRTTRDYLRFLDIALGSTYELQTQLRLSLDLHYHQDNETMDLVAEVERVLNGLIRSLELKIKNS